jgi:hypothetical protein
MIDDEIQQPIKNSVCASACAISENIDGNFSAERRIEKIDAFKNK